ncbi:hypothetical protein FBEOM_9311 [Fusarium beomiforme]|uniref:Uncharacterized protein n=1 Tax=Fusarium beomiforme TaxID=44412 RepID=A0A9P5DTH4_9HYPO|nr:hypothetical protein FBEOM_9311 [Fusarium beomiforme]
MGGKAFAHANPPLETPRMPNEVYLEVKNLVVRRLSEKFHWINCPMEGPGKKDHGDIDVLVSEMKTLAVFKDSVLDSIAEALGAEAKIAEGGDQISAHFAIRWPEHISIPKAVPPPQLVINITPPSPPGPSSRSSTTNTPGNLAEASDNASTELIPSTTTGKPPLDATLPSHFGPHPNPLGSNPVLFAKGSGPHPEPSAAEDLEAKNHTCAAVADSQTQLSDNDSDGASITSSECSQASAATAPVSGKWATLFPGRKNRKPIGPAPRSFSLSGLLKGGKSNRGSVTSNSNQNGLEKISSTLSEPPTTLSSTFRFKRKKTKSKSILTDNPFTNRSQTASKLVAAGNLFPHSHPVHDNPFRDPLHVYIQVDVRYCLTVKQAKYLRFFQSHGDLWQIVGSIIRPFGLTVDDKGLWIRVPEGELTNRKKAKVHLTSKPDEILKFLELPVAEYWRPFPDNQAMFEYIAKCPMFTVPRDCSFEEQMGLGTANDRRRMAQRPAYREWAQEFKPRCREKGLYAETTLTRDEIKEKAFNTFPIESEFHARAQAFIHDQNRTYIRKFIKSLVPMPDSPNDTAGFQRRSKTIKAMFAIVLERVDASEFGIAAPSYLFLGNGNWNMERTEDWIRAKVNTIDRLANMSEEEKEEKRSASALDAAKKEAEGS